MTTPERPRKQLVAVVGDAHIEPDSPKALLAERVGELLVDAGFTVVTGGLGGVMEAASRGAHRSAAYTFGATVGFLPGTDPEHANPFVDHIFPTGLDHARATVVSHADAMIAIGGGAGTLAEMALAWMHKRLLIALRVAGWSGRLADTPLDHRRPDLILGATTAEEAIAHLTTRLPHYTTRHTRIPA